MVIAPGSGATLGACDDGGPPTAPAPGDAVATAPPGSCVAVGADDAVADDDARGRCELTAWDAVAVAEADGFRLGNGGSELGSDAVGLGRTVGLAVGLGVGLGVGAGVATSGGTTTT